MITFYYEILESAGKTIKGKLQASTLAAAKTQLREKGYILIQIKAQRSHAFPTLQRFSKQDIALITRQLATLISAGIPVEEALQGVAEQTENAKVRTVLNGVRAQVLEGYSLAQALAEYGMFTELYRTTVEAGEQSGHLDKVLESLAEYTEQQEAMKQKVQQALLYPLIMMCVSFCIITFLLIYVVPSMIHVFSESGQTLPIMTILLITLSQWLQHYGLIILSIMIVSLIGLMYLLKKQQYKRLFHQFLLKIPLVRYFIQTVNVSRYIRTFSILFASGVNVLETMRLSAYLIQNLVMRQRFQEAALQVREGRDISPALKDTHFIPPMTIHLITSGEKSGELAPMMKHAAHHLEGELKRLIDTSLTLLEPAMIVIMGAVVMFIVLATLLPIFSMEQLVT